MATSLQMGCDFSLIYQCFYVINLFCSHGELERNISCVFDNILSHQPTYFVRQPRSEFKSLYNC